MNKKRWKRLKKSSSTSFWVRAEPRSWSKYTTLLDTQFFTFWYVLVRIWCEIAIGRCMSRALLYLPDRTLDIDRFASVQLHFTTFFRKIFSGNPIAVLGRAGDSLASLQFPLGSLITLIVPTLKFDKKLWTIRQPGNKTTRLNLDLRQSRQMYVQWGFENRTSPGFKWWKCVQLRNGAYFGWQTGIQIVFQYQTRNQMACYSPASSIKT